MTEAVTAAANTRPLRRVAADFLSLPWLRLRLWLAFRFVIPLARLVGAISRVVQTIWQPLVVFLAGTAFLIWLGERLVSVASDPVFAWWKLAAQWVVPVVLAFFVLRWALQARSRVVVGEFVDFRKSGKGEVLPGLGGLIVTKLLRFRDLYRTVADEPAGERDLDQPEIDSDRAIVATVKVEDVSAFGAISSEATIKVGGILDLPVGLLMTIFGRLVRGPRITGGVHERADGLTLVAQLVDSKASSGWRVDDPKPLLQRDGGEPRDLDDMATELACRIFTDLALSGAVDWRATFRFSEGLRKYRNRLISRKERPFMLRQAEHCFREALAADQRYGLAYYTYYNLGLVYNELGRLEAAERAFAEAIERFPGRWEAVYAGAWTRYRRIEREGPTASAGLDDVISLCTRVIDLQTATRGHLWFPPFGASVALAKAYDLRGSAERRLERPGSRNSAVQSRRKAVIYSWWAYVLASFTNTRPASGRRLAASCLRDLAVSYQHQQIVAPPDRGRERTFRRSEVVFGTVLALERSDARLHFELAEIYSKWGKPVEAFEQWDRAFRIRPSLRTLWQDKPDSRSATDPDASSALRLSEARELRRAGHLFDALAVAEESIVLDPFNAEGHDELAQILFQMNDAERARRAWEDALLLNPDEPSFYRQIAMCHWFSAQEATEMSRRREELVRAGEYLETAVERYGSKQPLEKAANHYWLAMLFLAREEYSRAVSQLRVVAAGAFAPIAVNLRLGEALLQMKSYEEAVRRLGDVIELGRKLEHVRTSSAEALGETGNGLDVDDRTPSQGSRMDVAEALGEHIGEWLSLDEALAWAHCQLASLYVDRDADLAAAMDELTDAWPYVRRITDPDSRGRCEAAFADCEGWALYKQGEAAKAIPSLERALTLGAREKTHWHLALACFDCAEEADDEDGALLLRRAEAHCRHVEELDLKEVYGDEVASLRVRIEHAHAQR